MPESATTHLPLAMNMHGSNGPVLVFGNSLGTNSSIWARQVARCSSRFRIVQFDYPGHGSAPDWKPYHLNELAEAVATGLERLGIRRFAYCGVSMGGALGVELALAYPERLAALVLCNTAAQFGTPEFWQARMEMASRDGLSAISTSTVARWLTEEDAADNPHKVQALQQIFESTSLDGYLHACHAVMHVDLRDRLKDVTVPTLIVAGSFDQATRPVQAQELHNSIKGSAYVELPAAHLGHLGAEDAFDRALIEFLEQTT